MESLIGNGGAHLAEAQQRTRELQSDEESLQQEICNAESRLQKLKVLFNVSIVFMQSDHCLDHCVLLCVADHDPATFEWTSLFN